MINHALPHRIQVSSSISASGRIWTVFVAGQSHAIFSGERAKERAVDSALWLAEDLRRNGTVQVVVDSPEHRRRATDTGRLAS
jgi:hypothetical protein